MLILSNWPHLRDGWRCVHSVRWWKDYVTQAEWVLCSRTAESGVIVFPLGAQLYHFTLSIFVSLWPVLPSTPVINVQWKWMAELRCWPACCGDVCSDASFPHRPMHTGSMLMHTHCCRISNVSTQLWLADFLTVAHDPENAITHSESKEGVN